MLQLNSKNISYQSVQVFLSLVSKFSDIANFKSSDKRVLGVMNDMAKTIEYARHHEESDDMTMSSRINNTPYKAEDYFYPKKAFKAMARQWSNQ